MRRQLWLLFIMACTLGLGAGPAASAAPEAAATTATQALAVRPGDRLALTWHFAAIPTDAPYKIEPGDLITLNFRYSPELSQLYFKQEEAKVSVLSQAYPVQPDGTLVLSGLKEPVAVLGQSTLEIEKILEEKYKGILQVPDVGVSVEPQYVFDKTLKDLVQPADESPILHVTIPPGGQLSLPLLPALATRGKSVDQLAAELTKHYRDLHYTRVTVSVWFDEAAARTVRVLGEVHTPGAYSLTAAGDLWGAIALAGGFTAQADPAAVRVIERDEADAAHPAARTRQFNFDAYVQGADPAADAALSGDALIFVPKKH